MVTGALGETSGRYDSSEDSLEAEKLRTVAESYLKGSSLGEVNRIECLGW
jgi:hypothetical protein